MRNRESTGITRHDMNLAWTGIIAVLFMVCLSIAAITHAVTDCDRGAPRPGVEQVKK